MTEHSTPETPDLPDLIADADAELTYHDVPAEEKKRGKAVPVIGFGHGGAAAGGVATSGMALGAAMAGRQQPPAAPAVPHAPETTEPRSVSFGQEQLTASVRLDGSGQILDDPWGAEDDDEYAVPGLVTGSEEREKEDRRKAAAGMAMRGSGTRGGAKGGAPGGMPMMAPGGMAGGAGAPGATLGGIGGPNPMAATLPGGMAPNAGQMPLTMLQSATTSRAAAPSAFAPSSSGGSSAMSAGGLSAAAGTGTGIYDPEYLKDALRSNGFDPDGGLTGPNGLKLDADGRILQGSDPAADPDLVDTDGDGIPDTPRSEAERRQQRTTAPTAGVYGAGLSGANSGATSNPAVPSANNSSSTSSGVHTPSGAYTPTTGSGAPSTSGSNPLNPTQSNTGPTSTTPGSSPSAASTSFNSTTPTYQPTGGSDFAVTSSDLRRDANKWEDISQQSQPIQQTILNSPEPSTMFGIMKSPVTPYQTAVGDTAEYVQASGNTSMKISNGLTKTATNYEDAEQAATAEARKSAQ